MELKRRGTSPIKRRKLSESTSAAVGVDYFSSYQKEGIEFFSSGCILLDSVLGGGYALGRITNIVGDKSAGKTLLAIEACANFVNTFPNGHIRYAEAEAAFDESYAEALGMPIDKVSFADEVDTVEALFNDIQKTIDKLKGAPGLYIVDSLDALSDQAEKDREIDDKSYGMTKQKQLSTLFRKQVRVIEQNRLCIIIISQIRDKIGVTFGETKSRSGGKALDFYASQVIWLHEIGKIKKTVAKIDRVVGVQVRAKCKKNKVGLPFRECDYPILFGYGIDDLTASAEWLIDNHREHLLQEVGLSKAGYKIRINHIRNNGGSEAKALRDQLTPIIKREWSSIEVGFLPKSRKY